MEIENRPCGERAPGGPSASDIAIERRILDAAQICFAESGYASTSLHVVSMRASVTPESLRRYFSAKPDLYVALLDQTERLVYDRLRTVAGRQPSFVACLEAALDEVVHISDTDPMLMRFLGTVAGDLSRSVELRAARQVHWPRQRAFVTELVDAGIARGELADIDRLLAVDTITAMLEGLWQVNALIPGALAVRVQGLKRCLTGALLRDARS